MMAAGGAADGGYEVAWLRPPGRRAPWGYPERAPTRKVKVRCSCVDGLIHFPAHALLIVEERLREQASEGVSLPEGMPLDELALRVLVAAARIGRTSGAGQRRGSG